MNKKISYHMSIGIVGLEERLKNGPQWSWQILEHDTTHIPLTRQEVEEMIAKCKAKGYIVIPGCENHDNRGFCKGHPSKG